MIRQQAQVAAFMRLFEQETPALPKEPSQEIINLRLDLIREEWIELGDAFAFHFFEGEFSPAGLPADMTAVADAIGDLLYVVYGTAVACGIDIGPVFDEIQRSNMSKEWKTGPRIQRSPSGKVLKPPTYSPADIAPILAAQGPIQYRPESKYLNLTEQDQNLVNGFMEVSGPAGDPIWVSDPRNGGTWEAQLTELRQELLESYSKTNQYSWRSLISYREFLRASISAL